MTGYKAGFVQCPRSVRGSVTVRFRYGTGRTRSTRTSKAGARAQAGFKVKHVTTCHKLLPIRLKLQDNTSYRLQVTGVTYGYRSVR